MFISTFFIFISFSRATLFVKATTSITHCSLLITHLCKYVKEHRQTPFPFVDDAKVETKKRCMKQCHTPLKVFL